MLLGVDVSSHQYPPDPKKPAFPPPDYDTMHASGMVDYVVSKASEGTSYRNPNMGRDRSEAHRLGLGFGMYHFARAGHPLDEADYFCDTFGTLSHGEFLWLDWEVDTLNAPVWCRTFLDHVFTRTTVKGVVYMDRSRQTDPAVNWKPVVSANYGLALASYDNNPGNIPNPAPWAVPAFKQFTDAGKVPGIAVAVDRLVFYGERASLDKYGFQGVAPKPVPTPPPAPRPVPVPPKPAPLPTGPGSLPTLRAGDKGEIIGKLQLFLNKNYPAYSNIVVTRWYGPSTVTVVKDFQHRSGITTPDADGTIIGPKTNAALWAAGWRG